jgi:hypothetical protein
MFTADDVEVKGGSKYQGAGVNEKVAITEINLVELASGKKVIEMKTINEHNQEGKSRRLYLDTNVSEGRSASAWTVSAKYLLNLIMAANKSTSEEAKVVLKADNEVGLVKNLNTALIGKPFRGLFSSKEYQPGKFAIELYGSESIGGTRLVFDANNVYMNSLLPKASATSDLPF